MTITAQIIEDSVSTMSGVRLTTLQLCYPRMVHSEFLTHRVFTRNASSSRAIPVAKMIKMIRDNPAMPIHWGKNQPGMQAHEELTGYERATVKAEWLRAADNAADTAERMMAAGAHKQVVNRILEPFQHIHVIVTSTEWDNFFELRDHPDAQPEIRELAIQMKLAMDASAPKWLKSGEWHLPYVSDEEREIHPISQTRVMSGARCARVSYLTHDGAKPTMNGDMELYDQLVTSKPMHASPIEHQAVAGVDSTAWSGNFRGWTQYRKLVELNIA